MEDFSMRLGHQEYGFHFCNEEAHEHGKNCRSKINVESYLTIRPLEIDLHIEQVKNFIATHITVSNPVDSVSRVILKDNGINVTEITFSKFWVNGKTVELVKPQAIRQMSVAIYVIDLVPEKTTITVAGVVDIDWDYQDKISESKGPYR